MSTWLGIPIVLAILILLMVNVLISFACRELFEYIVTKRDIFHFSIKHKSGGFSFTFFCIFCGMYLPGINILFIIAQLIMVEMDNLRLMKYN